MDQPDEHDQQNSWKTTYQRERLAHWNAIALKMDTWSGWGGSYHKRLSQIYRFLVPPGQRVLEIGCGQGDLLASLEPSEGIGVDFSPEMICRARKRYPQMRFIEADAHEFSLDDKFDIIILSDLINDLWDVQKVFQNLSYFANANTRLILNSYSRLWHIPLMLAARLGLVKPNLIQNWLTVEDIAGLLKLSGFEVIRSWQDVLLPLPIPLLNEFSNRVLVKLWPFHQLALTNFILARPQGQYPTRDEERSVSIIIPARNEAGNIPHIFDRVPEMGSSTELLFVEGNSTDDTYAIIEQLTAAQPERRGKMLKQKGIGKGDAVRLGFEQARGDILMILDADLTVLPEDLPRFYTAIVTGKGEFINGVRLVYPMQKEAMRYFNLIGNKFFSLAFSWLLGQPIKDTLCGTKVLWKCDYDKIAANRAYFGDFDPFGDFDLLFGAARLGLKIIDLPIRYHERTYGTTNIQRWKHGVLLLKMVLFAALRIKFI